MTIDVNFSSCLFSLKKINADMEDLKNFCKDQGAAEAEDLNHWDINFWSERLRESKYDINEVWIPILISLSLSYPCAHFSSLDS